MEELQTAWSALEGAGAGEGWQAVAIRSCGPAKVHAARYYPGDTEAVLLTFSFASGPPTGLLPSGMGFNLIRASMSDLTHKETRFALNREPAGRVDIFEKIVEDILGLMQSFPEREGSAAARALVSRIEAWQSFMKRGAGARISEEGERGLIGELLVLRGLVENGWPLSTALQAWVGPDRDVHDFRIGQSSIEVKTAMGGESFIVRISSLEQLSADETISLFLGVVALSAVAPPDGFTLPGYVSSVAELAAGEPATLASLYDRLAKVGYHHLEANSYTRTYAHVRTFLLTVADDFPRLTRINVPSEVKSAEYRLDLTARALTQSLELSQALELMGGQ